MAKTVSDGFGSVGKRNRYPTSQTASVKMPIGQGQYIDLSHQITDPQTIKQRQSAQKATNINFYKDKDDALWTSLALKKGQLNQNSG